MRRRFLLTSLSLIGMLLGGQAGAQPAVDLPPGEGRDLVAVACSQCHNLRTIMSLHDGAAGWRHYVYDMVLRGAQLNAAEAETVIGYLAANFGPTVQQNVPAAQLAALPEGPGKDLIARRCTACHDLQRIAATKRQKSEWDAVVANMVNRGAAATPDESKVITAYLVSRFGSD